MSDRVLLIKTKKTVRRKVGQKWRQTRTHLFRSYLKYACGRIVSRIEEECDQVGARCGGNTFYKNHVDVFEGEKSEVDCAKCKSLIKRGRRE